MKRKINLIGIGTDGGHSLTREAMERISPEHSTDRRQKNDKQCEILPESGCAVP